VAGSQTPQCSMPKKASQRATAKDRRRRGRNAEVCSYPRRLETDKICIVRSKSTASDSDQFPPPNVAQYGTLQHAFDYFNAELFNRSLPQVLITHHRDHRSYGYFSGHTFQRRTDAKKRIHEICLNPDGFVGRTDREILSTLVHEMTHLSQYEYGNPGRGGYHNREWALLMYSIGLMPSATGKPGGATTGDHISHYIREDGPFATACDAFLKKYQLVWESAFEPATDSASPASGVHSGARGGANTGRRYAAKSKTKFSCPNGHVNAWARPNANLLCGDCYKETHEAVPLLSNEESHGRPRGEMA
jgi:hypothetical protein